MRKMTRALAATAMAMAILSAGCTRTGTDEAPVPAPATPSATPGNAVQTAPVLHPCSILADTSVALAVAGAGAGQRVNDDEAAGISTCSWPVGAGAVLLQVSEAAGPGALTHELSAATLEVVDIHRPDAASVVPIEAFDGVGDQAGAYVVHVDSKRGIRKSNAVMMVQKGTRLAVLRIPQLADGDHAKAVAAMKKLGLEIASRL